MPRLMVSPGHQQPWQWSHKICRYEIWFPWGRDFNYCQTSNISHTLVGNKIVDHWHVVGTSPVSPAPTTSSFSTWHLASMDWAMTTARPDEKCLSLTIWCILYSRFDSTLAISGRKWNEILCFTLQWRHNGHDSVSNHQPHDCLLSRLLRRRSKKTSKLRITGLCVGNSPGTGGFPAQMASNVEIFSIWWRHHVDLLCQVWWSQAGDFSEEEV